MEDRSFSGRGLTRSDLEKEFFDDYYQQRHIDGKWVDLETYLSNSENRLNKRIDYDLCTEPATFSQEQINDRCQELTDLLSDVENYQQYLNTMLRTIDKHILNHLWIDQSFSKIASKTIQENLSRVNSLANKIETIQSGFKQLPVVA